MNNLKKGIITFIFMGCGICSWPQGITDESTLELAQLLHKQRIEQILVSLPELSTDSVSVDVNDQKELYKSIAKKYRERFKPTELKELTTFYTSPTGKKLLKEYPLMMADANRLISKWEMKQLGIEEIEMDEAPILLDEEVIDLAVVDTIVSQPRVQPQKKEVLVVKTLEQLKVLLKKDPDLLYDSIELSKILNISLEPEIIDMPEPAVNLEIESNNPNKN